MIRDRIKELRRVKGRELFAHPLNFRTHPEQQATALRGVLDRIGLVDAAIAYETPEGLRLIDGHLRASVMPDDDVPVLVLDVNDAEAAQVLATFDQITSLAERDSKVLGELFKTLQSTADLDLARLAWPEYVVDPLLSATWTPIEATPNAGGAAPGHRTVTLTVEQHEVVMRAVVRLRDINDDQSITEGRSLELICADFLAGA